MAKGKKAKLNKQRKRRQAELGETLEKQRLQDGIAGGVSEKQKDSEIFFVDKKPGQRNEKSLHIDQYLSPHPNIKPLINKPMKSKKRKASEIESSKSTYEEAAIARLAKKLKTKKEKENQKSLLLQNKEENKVIIKKKPKKKTKKPKKKVSTQIEQVMYVGDEQQKVVVTDIWSIQQPCIDEKNDWRAPARSHQVQRKIEEEKVGPRNRLIQTKKEKEKEKNKQKLGKTQKKRRQKKLIESALLLKKGNPLQLPTTGLSYKPSFQSHQDELGKALAKVVKDQDQEKRINKQLKREKLTKEQAIKIKELKDKFNDNQIVDLDSESDSDSDSDSENEDSIADISTIKKTTVDVNGEPIRKTTAQRNKQIKQKHQKTLKRQKMKKKRQNVQFTRMPVLIKEINKKQQISELKIKEKIEKEKEYQNSTKKLGPNKYDENNDFDHIVFTDQLPTSLLKVKPPVNAFSDRFHNFEKRNIIETRLPHRKQQRYSPKVYEK